MNIRPENKTEYDIIYQLVKTAFETARMKEGDEQDFVDRLRASGNYIPELALVAEEDGKMIGHIMLTRTYVESENGKFEALLLGPLSVLLEHREKGVGSKLARTSLSLARDMGFKAVFLAGNRAYYSRFGFVPALRYGIKCNIEVPEELIENIMACELVPNALEGVHGTVKMT
jgi:predicted N-acetyltransferase YhbS